MGPGQRRSDLRANAQAKLDDAILLLKNGRYSNAYYLAGYAVEIGLKACIAAQISAETIPDKGFIKNILNHQFRILVGLAGLAGALKDEESKDQAFATNWALAAQWEPDTRYQAIDPMSAQLLVQAVADANSGVLRWIKAHW
jgi:AbiV family abortive infection protein